MKNSEYSKSAEVLLEDPRGHRRTRPAFPSVVPLPTEDTTNTPRLNASNPYSTTSPRAAVVYPYQQYDSEPQPSRQAYHSYHATQQTAHAGSSGHQSIPYPWPAQQHSSPSYEYPRHPPSSSRRVQYPPVTDKNKEKREHPLKKANVSKTNAQHHSTMDSSSEGEEMTSLMKGIQDISYGAVDTGTRRVFKMSSAQESSFAAKTMKARSRNAHGEELEPPSQRPPKRPGNSAGTSNHDVSPRRSHRRHNSDHSRTADVPTRARSLTNYDNSPLRPRHGLPRTLSSSSLNNTPAASSRHHRRRSSNSVFSSVGSIMTDASMTTLVLDIEKSSLFAGYDSVTGQVLYKLPISSVQISMEEHQAGMTPGEFYQIRENDQTFENYHRLGDAQFGLDEDLGRTSHAFTPQHALPPTRYVIHAPADLYRRMVDEISRSASLPCGIFFCGHHDDVAKPSLIIPIVVLACFFGLMGFVAYTYRG